MRRPCNCTLPAAPRGLKSAARRAARTRDTRAFTLTEILVVIGIIVLLALVAVPAVNQMWEQRKNSEAETILRGALMNARQRAMGQRDTGLLFFVDSSGTQQIVMIEQWDEEGDKWGGVRLDESGRPRYADVPGQQPGVRDDIVSRNRFRIVPGFSLSLSRPMRVAPSAVLRTPPSNPARDRKASFETYSDAELVNNDFENPRGRSSQEEYEPQRHRNFFSVVFSPQGQLLVGREVLVYDEDGESGMGSQSGTGRGDVTGLPVDPTVTKQASGRYEQPGDERPYPLYLADERATLAHMVTVAVKNERVAAVFPSVRGVIVYDDALFQRAAVGAHRQFLMDTARPYYISSNTGDIIRGSQGASGG